MEIRFLGKTPLAQIVACFNRAFADYIVPFQAEEGPMRRRWLSCRVDYGLSYGAFDQDELVGFMMTGIDRWNGRRTAYNSGTGVIPEYRGQKIVKQLYEKAIPSFRENGIDQCILEVIVGNDRAIKAYAGVGFQSKRQLKCYSLQQEPAVVVSNDLEFKQVFQSNWEAYREMLEFEPSWENSRSATAFLGRDIAIWEMYQGEHLLGFFIMKPETGHILQFGLQRHADWLAAGKELLLYAAGINPKLKVNNVDSRAERSLSILQALGMKNVADQHELELDLNTRKKSRWNFFRR